MEEQHQYQGVSIAQPALDDTYVLIVDDWNFIQVRKGTFSAIKDLNVRMSSEDFSYFSQQCPSCFFRLGVANSKKNINHLVHTPYFNIDEESLKVGVGLMSYLTIFNLLTQKTI